MKHSRLYLYGAALAALLLAVACYPPTVPTPVPPTITLNCIGNSCNGPSPAPSPSPGAEACAAAIDSIRVNPFGYECDPGVSKPANNSGLLPMGCTAAVTATPKDKAGKDVPAEVHGSGITWSVVLGASHVEVTDWPAEPFNKNARAVSPGEFSLSATVCGHTGAWNGRVTAP